VLIKLLWRERERERERERDSMTQTSLMLNNYYNLATKSHSIHPKKKEEKKLSSSKT